MTVTRAQAVGLPIRVKLAGEWYTASTWVQTDFAEWEEWLKSEYERDMLDGLSPEDRSSILLQVRQRKSEINFSSKESINKLSTPVGFLRCWWMSLRKNHPDMTEDEAAVLLLHPDTNAEELAKFKIITRSTQTRSLKKKRKKK